MKRISVLLLLLVVAAAGAAAGEKPKRQIVNLKKMNIEGTVPDPATMFIRERQPGGLLELFPLKRELREEWLLPVIKGNFDRATVELVDGRKR